MLRAMVIPIPIGLIWRGLVIIVLALPRLLFSGRSQARVQEVAAELGLSLTGDGVASGVLHGHEVRVSASTSYLDARIQVPCVHFAAEVRTRLPTGLQVGVGMGPELRAEVLGTRRFSGSSSLLRVPADAHREVRLLVLCGVLRPVESWPMLVKRGVLSAQVVDEEGLEEVLGVMLHLASQVGAVLDSPGEAPLDGFQTDPESLTPLLATLSERDDAAAAALADRAAAWAMSAGDSGHLAAIASLETVSTEDAARSVARAFSLEDEHDEDHAACLLAAGRREIELSPEVYAAAVVSTEPTVRLAAASALRFAADQGRGRLVALLADPSLDVRVAAATSLGQIGRLDDVEVLRATGGGLTTPRAMKRACENAVALIQARVGGSAGTLRLVDEGGELALSDAAVE